MEKSCAQAMKLSALAIGCALGVSGVAFARAVPAGTATFDGGACTAKFVRSASGIVMETNRVCTGDQNPWIDADVVIQFRPLEGRPNPECDPAGLVTTFVFGNTDPALARWFGAGEQFNACVYLEDPVVAAGAIDSADADGITSDAVPLAGTYQVCVRGTWANRGGMDLVDAEYVSQDAWATFANGLPGSDPQSAALGPDWGDVTIDGQFVDWGSHDAAHRYCTTLALQDGQAITLGVFDGTAGTPVPEWYADNVGSLTYTLRYVGP